MTTGAFKVSRLWTLAAMLIVIRIDALSSGLLDRKARKLSDLDANPELPRVVVVGGGVGGLAVASRIASVSEVCQVIVLEKNEFVGGRCGSFVVATDKGTFRHERGPSLLLLKGVYEELFRDCSPGKSARDYGLDIKPCIPAYQVVFDDGDRIDLGFPKACNQQEMKELEWHSRAKMESYEAHGASKWDEYMASTAAFLDCGLPNFIEEKFDLASFPAFLREALRGFGKAWPLKPHSDVLDATFASNKMKALASFQNLYVGLEPYRNDDELFGGVLRKTAPAVFGLLAAIELHPENKFAGVFAPVGGFEAVTRSFEKLAEEKGVQIQCNAVVTKVTDRGVYVQDEEGKSIFLTADLVVVNADLPFATKSLLSKQDENIEKYDWDDALDYCSGVIAFHWSIDKKLGDLNTHNVFLISESRSKAEASWRSVRSSKVVGGHDVEPFNFYVHRASATDPTAAPEGCDSILVLVPSATLLRSADLSNLPRDEAIHRYKEQFDETRISRVRDAVLKRLTVVESLKDLQRHIIDEIVDTPGTYADQYNVAAGTPFAMVCAGLIALFFRLPWWRIGCTAIIKLNLNQLSFFTFQSHGFSQLSVTRPAAESPEYPNVMFIGASSRPGNGVPLVLIGAKLVAKKASKKIKRMSFFV
jgi:phytoene desaturase (3,4-didehydrolycopene-forming)